MVTLLPQELLDTVMDYVLEDDDNPSSSLKVASLICRSFVVSSQSRLFATIYFRPPPDKKEASTGCGLWSTFMTGPKLGSKTSIEAFGRSIAASPHLLGYVRSINLFTSPRPPQPSPDHRDSGLNSESHHLMTFLPNLAPKLRSFGMYLVDWNTILPEVQEAIKIVFESRLLTDLTLENTFNFPIPLFASSEHQKSKLISLKLSAADPGIDWFSTENCIFDISHLRHLCIYLGQNLSEVFRICSGSLKSFEISGCRNSDQQYFDTIDMSSLTALRKLHFHLFLNSSPSVTSSPQSLSPWFNRLLKRQSPMLALEEIIIDILIMSYTLSIPLDLLFFSETDSILARRVNLPALQSVTILVEFSFLACDQGRYMFNVIETIKMQMPLLHGMGIVRVHEQEQGAYD